MRDHSENLLKILNVVIFLTLSKSEIIFIKGCKMTMRVAFDLIKKKWKAKLKCIKLHQCNKIVSLINYNYTGRVKCILLQNYDYKQIKKTTICLGFTSRKLYLYIIFFHLNVNKQIQNYYFNS